MDFDLLTAFTVVAQHNSFSKAAQALYLTQPAISKRISSLEQHLKTPLFDRVGKQVQLTQAGRALLPQAQTILALMKQARQSISDISGTISGELSISTSHHIGLHKLPPVLRQFANAYPQVNLKISFLDSEVAIEQVLHGVTEMAVVTLPTQSIQHIELEALWQDPLVFVCEAKNSANMPQSLAALSALPAILPDSNTYTGRLIRECFEQRGMSLNNHMATNYLETIKMMVSVGLGWSVLPESMVDEHLHVIEVDEISLQRSLGIATHCKKHLSNAAQAFCHSLRLHGSESEIEITR